MLQFATVTVTAAYEPPRPTITPKKRVVAVQRSTIGAALADHREDWGLTTTSAVRFVSSETQGFLTATQVAALQALYETGAAFALTTDLLSPLGQPAVTYAAVFDETVEPLFTPATPGGNLYRFDILVRI